MRNVNFKWIFVISQWCLRVLLGMILSLFGV